MLSKGIAMTPDMLHKLKTARIPCSFNITVSRENLNFVPDLVQWSVDKADKVWSFIFICYRAVLLRPDREYYFDGQKINPEKSTLGNISETDSLEDIAKTAYVPPFYG